MSEKFLDDDFELNCSQCLNYGSLFCRICKARYCFEHKCFHLPSFEVDFSNLESGSPEPELDPELELESLASILSLPTPVLKQHQDKLFEQLKLIQRELESRVHGVTPFNHSSRSKHNPKPSKKSKADRKLKALLRSLNDKGLLAQILPQLLRKD